MRIDNQVLQATFKQLCAACCQSLKLRVEGLGHSMTGSLNLQMNSQRQWMVIISTRAGRIVVEEYFCRGSLLPDERIEDAIMCAMDAAISTHKGLKRRATVICRHEGEILFVRKRNAKWNLPGGRVEKSETPLQAALREMAEETGLTFDQLSYVSEYKDDKVIHFLFEAKRAEHQKPRASNEIEDCRWFTAKELGKRNVRGAIRTLLKRYASGGESGAIIGRAA